MNLLNQLDAELKNKHLNDFEKIRYIYLRTCELFSFDGKYYFPKNINEEKYQEMLNRNIDITTLTDFLVVCHSYSREILFKLIRELTTATVTLHDSAHSYVLYEEKPGYTWKLDATHGDFPRVKLRVKPTGFHTPKSNGDERLAETDSLLRFVYKSKKDYLSKLNLESTELLFQSINLLLLNSECKYQYSDALYFIKWLLLGVMYPFSESNGIDNDYNFYHFFTAGTNPSIFCLSKNDGFYTIQKMPKEKCLTLTRSINMSIENIPDIKKH